MRFDAYICDLLYRYECVILPDFGAFLTRQTPARLDDSAHIFYPPGKVVSFNEQLKANDGILAQYIASVEKIPYEAALKKINKKTKALKSYLAQGEVLNFRNIGEISLNDSGKIVFEPSGRLNFLSQSFGLAQVSSPAISREVYKKTVETLEEAAPITITPERRKSRSYLKYAAVAVIALSIGGFLTSKYYLNQIETHNQMAEETAQEQLESKIQEATFIIDNPLPAVTVELEKQSGNYHLVAGAFRVEENCIKKLEELKGLGYKARRIGKNKYGLHQVVYASYESRSEAQRNLYKIRRSHNKDAWLLIQELN